MYRPVIIAPEVRPVFGPIIFLAGPIQGAPDWQAKAISQLAEDKSDVSFAIASPRRTDVTWKNAYDEQVEWETRYLKRAARDGVILFWLAKEETPIPGRSYAQTSRYELGEWLTAFKGCGCRHLVIGIEDGFTGAKYIRKRAELHKLDEIDYFTKAPKLTVRTSLAATCLDAIDCITNDLQNTW